MSIQNRSRKIALTGADGYIGSAVLRALVAAESSVSALTREPRWRDLAGARSIVAPAGLTDTSALSTLLDGVDTLIHAASYVGARPDLQQSVNVEGTERVVAVAKRCGVRRVVYLSTATVYGKLPRNGLKEGELSVNPSTELSTSRARAEEIVLESGGTIVRPSMVYGQGDRWFLGRYVSVLKALGAWPGGGDALVSVIDRTHLGRLIAGVALQDVPDRVLHASLPRPTRVRELAGQILDYLGVEAPSRAIRPDEAFSIMGPIGVRESQVESMTEDSWFDSSRIWEATGIAPPAEAVVDSASLDWYAQNVRSTAEAMQRLVRGR